MKNQVKKSVRKRVLRIGLLERLSCFESTPKIGLPPETKLGYWSEKLEACEPNLFRSKEQRFSEQVEITGIA